MRSFSKYLAEQRSGMGGSATRGKNPSGVRFPIAGQLFKGQTPRGTAAGAVDRPQVSVPGFIPGTTRTTTLRPRETPEQGKRILDTDKAKTVAALGLGASETARTAEKIHQDTKNYAQSMYPGIEWSRSDTAKTVAAGGVPPVDVVARSSDIGPDIASGIVKGITTAAAPMSTVPARDQLGTATADVVRQAMTATDPYGERKMLSDPRGAEYVQKLEKELIRRAQPKYDKLKAGKLTVSDMPDTKPVTTDLFGTKPTTGSLGTLLKK